MSKPKMIIIQITLLFLIGVTTGIAIQNLEMIKNLSPTETYYVPLTGMEFTLAQVWDMTRFWLYAAFILTCFVAIHLGSLITRLVKEADE